MNGETDINALGSEYGTYLRDGTNQLRGQKLKDVLERTKRNYWAFATAIP